MKTHSPVSARNPPHAWSAWLVALLMAAAILGIYFGSVSPTGRVTALFQTDEADTVNTVTTLTPASGVTIRPEEAITFTARNGLSSGTYIMKLYISQDGSPGEEDELVDEKTVRWTQTYTYTHIPTPAWGEGVYYWKITSQDVDGGIVSSSVNTYEVRAPLAASLDTEAEYEASCTGGAGGHVSDALGEKTFVGFSIPANETITLHYNKANRHGIEHIAVRALTNLRANAFIIHQEFENAPNYTLPPVSDVYKTIHVQQTSPWGENTYYSTVFFRVPKQWLRDAGRTFHEVHIQTFNQGKWSPVPTFLEREEGEDYVFQSTLAGLPPFAIGACPYTREGRLVRG